MTTTEYQNILKSYDTMISRATPETAMAVLSDIQHSIHHVLNKSQVNNKCVYPGDCPYTKKHKCTNLTAVCSYRK